jgi:hypothetical protein
VNGEAAAPVVDTVNPASGTIGTEVTITGSGFTGVTGVSLARRRAHLASDLPPRSSPRCRPGPRPGWSQ